MDIAAWLHGLGLQQYQQVFRENVIDDAVLPELTADDLKDLGVSLVGHRRKLFAAIAALRSESGSEPREEAGDVTDTFLACGLNVSCGYRSSAGNERSSARRARSSMDGDAGATSAWSLSSLVSTVSSRAKPAARSSCAMNGWSALS